MTGVGGFEEAKQRRNLLERLVDKIPGFKGFQNRELRRDVDRMQREYLAERTDRIRRRLQDLVRDYTDAGKIGLLTPFDRLDKRLDGLSQSIRFSDYGHSGLFDPVKFYDEELEKLYAFDLSVIEDLDGLEVAVARVPGPGGEDPRPALDELGSMLDALRRKWAERETVISGVVQTGNA